MNHHVTCRPAECRCNTVMQSLVASVKIKKPHDLGTFHTVSVMKAESALPCSNAIVSPFLHQICVPFLSFHGETGNCQRGTGPAFVFIELKVSGMTGITDAVYLFSAVQQEQLSALTIHPINEQLRRASSTHQGFVLTKPWERTACHARSTMSGHVFG